MEINFIFSLYPCQLLRFSVILRLHLPPSNVCFYIYEKYSLNLLSIYVSVFRLLTLID